MSENPFDPNFFMPEEFETRKPGMQGSVIGDGPQDNPVHQRSTMEILEEIEKILTPIQEIIFKRRGYEKFIAEERMKLAQRKRFES